MRQPPFDIGVQGNKQAHADDDDATSTKASSLNDELKESEKKGRRAKKY